MNEIIIHRKMSGAVKIGMKNLQRIQFDKFEKDFSFIVNGKIYKTNSFVANILSPNISKMLEGNINTSYYQINTKYEKDFNRIIEYGEMKPINVKEEEEEYFQNVLKELGNFEEFVQFSKKFQGDLSFENAIERLKTKQEFNINFDEEISYISTNFHDIYNTYPETILKLDIDIIERIISNDQIRLCNEEELFDIIFKLYQESKEYSTLFSYVTFINLSRESIVKFREYFDINDINKCIWESICYRLEQDISNESKEAYEKSHQEFLMNRYLYKREETIIQNFPEQHHENIIQYLSERYHGNVHTKGIVHISASSIVDDVQNVVEQNDHKYFSSEDKTGSWIQFDFKERKILLDHYTIKNKHFGKEHLKSWILEVSNDGKNYEIIDRQKNCELLHGPLKSGTFKVSQTTPQRYIRLKQTGQNWFGFNTLYINQIEFSGNIYE